MSPMNAMNNCTLTHQANAIITIIYCYLSAAVCSSCRAPDNDPNYSSNSIVRHTLFAIAPFSCSRTARTHLLHFVDSTIKVVADKVALKSTFSG